eukprot:SAG31_NODE_3025_length_4778_cov_1.763838_4_plen_246_part_01
MNPPLVVPSNIQKSVKVTISGQSLGIGFKKDLRVTKVGDAAEPDVRSKVGEGMRLTHINDTPINSQDDWKAKIKNSPRPIVLTFAPATTPASTGVNASAPQTPPKQNAFASPTQPPKPKPNGFGAPTVSGMGGAAATFGKPSSFGGGMGTPAAFGRTSSLGSVGSPQATRGVGSANANGSGPFTNKQGASAGGFGSYGSGGSPNPFSAAAAPRGSFMSGGTKTTYNFIASAATQHRGGNADLYDD